MSAIGVAEPGIVNDAKLEDTRNANDTEPEDSDSTDSAYTEPPEYTSTGQVYFQFGPNGSYFLTCRDKWCYCGTNFRPNDEFGLVKPYIVALAPNGSWFTAYGDIAQDDRWRFSINIDAESSTQIWDIKDNQSTSRSSSKDPYSMLSSWIKPNFDGLNAEQLRKSTLTFGPGLTPVKLTKKSVIGSYYARTPRGCIWSNLPADLEKTVVHEMTRESGKGPPANITLGQQGAWVAFWNDGSYTWNLRGTYSRLDENLEAGNSDQGGIQMVTISPYNDDFVIHYRSGLIAWKISIADESYRKSFTKLCYGYMQERAREDNITFRMDHWRGNESWWKRKFASQIILSPDSRQDQVDNGVMRQMSKPFLGYKTGHVPLLVGIGIGASVASLILGRRALFRKIASVRAKRT
ncbi:abc drug exporter [Physcia stellaris]|nr:abc drug exporter [Physcia stellaris]